MLGWCWYQTASYDLSSWVFLRHAWRMQHHIITVGVWGRVLLACLERVSKCRSKGGQADVPAAPKRNPYTSYVHSDGLDNFEPIHANHLLRLSFPLACPFLGLAVRLSIDLSRSRSPRDLLCMNSNGNRSQSAVSEAETHAINVVSPLCVA